MAISGLYPAANAWFQGGPAEYYPGQTVAGFNPMHQQAWQSAINAGQSGVNNAATQQQRAGNLWNSFSGQLGQGNQLQGDWSQWDNPAFQSTVDNYQDAMHRGFQRNTIPQQEMSAIGSGQLGSSRHGIAQGLAMSDLNRSISDTVSNMYSSQYNTGMDRYLQADRANQAARQNMWMMAPQMYGIQQTAGNNIGSAFSDLSNIQSGIANQWQGMNQSRIAADMDRWNYYAGAPYQHMSQYNNLLQPSMAYTTSTGANPNYQNPWAGALGGAMSGWSIANQWGT